jgi:hypothetical protein
MSVAERSSLRQLRGVLTVLAIPLVVGCPDVNQGLSTTQQEVIQEAAANYDFDAERPPLRIRDPQFPGAVSPGDAGPTMTISTMHLKPGRERGSHRLIARIKSEGDYPAMGIYTGMNYIWRSSWDTTGAAAWVTKVVSTKPSTPEHVLARDPRMHEYTTGDPAEPRLVHVTKASFAIAACLDDPMCGSGHCGYF